MIGNIKNDVISPILKMNIPFGLDSGIKKELRDFFEKNKNTDWLNKLNIGLKENYYHNGFFCQVVNYTNIPNIRTPLIGTKPDRSLRSKCRKYKYSILGIIISCGLFTPMFIWFYSLRSKPTVGTGIGIFAGTFIISVIGAIVINNLSSCSSGNGKYT